MYPLRILGHLLFRFRHPEPVERRECLLAGLIVLLLLAVCWAACYYVADWWCEWSCHSKGRAPHAGDYLGYYCFVILFSFVPLLYYLSVKLIILAAQRYKSLGLSIGWVLGLLVPCVCLPFLELYAFLLVYMLLMLVPDGKA